MHKKLQTLISPQIEPHIAVYGTGIGGRKATDAQTEGLFVLLRGLSLCGIKTARNGRRKYIVNRLAIAVFLNIDRTYFKGSLGDGRYIGIVQLTVVGAPFAPYQLKRTEAKMRCFLKPGEEKAHKANTFEIRYTSDGSFVFLERNFELIPIDRFLLSVSKGNCGGAYVGDVILPHGEAVRSKYNMVLKIAFVFVQRIILIDVFHIRHYA